MCVGGACLGPRIFCCLQGVPAHQRTEIPTCPNCVQNSRGGAGVEVIKTQPINVLTSPGGGIG